MELKPKMIQNPLMHLKYPLERNIGLRDDSILKKSQQKREYKNVFVR